MVVFSISPIEILRWKHSKDLGLDENPLPFEPWTNSNYSFLSILIAMCEWPSLNLIFRISPQIKPTVWVLKYKYYNFWKIFRILAKTARLILEHSQIKIPWIYSDLKFTTYTFLDKCFGCWGSQNENFRCKLNIHFFMISILPLYKKDGRVKNNDSATLILSQFFWNVKFTLARNNIICLWVCVFITAIIVWLD